MNLTPLQTVREYYQSLVPGRRQELMEILDPHLVLEVPQCFPGGGGVFHGLKAYIEDFLYGLYGTFDCEFPVEEILDAGDTVIALGRQRGRVLTTGEPVDVPFAHIWTVRQGRLVRGRMFSDTAALCQLVARRPAPTA
jgi:ketosteroid isomerase-like protein